jgi:hypothetical protein
MLIIKKKSGQIHLYSPSETDAHRFKFRDKLDGENIY